MGTPPPGIPIIIGVTTSIPLFLILVYVYYRLTHRKSDNEGSEREHNDTRQYSLYYLRRTS